MGCVIVCLVGWLAERISQQRSQFDFNSVLMKGGQHRMLIFSLQILP